MSTFFSFFRLHPSSYRLPNPFALLSVAGLVLVMNSTTAEPERALRFDSGKTWVFNPGRDAFKDDALLDLRSLNEKEAGATGFVKRSADGSGFTLGDGTPVRFWAVGDTVYTRSNADWLTMLASWPSLA